MKAAALLAASALWLANDLVGQQDLASLVDQLAAAEPQARSQAYNELMRRRAPETVPLIGKRIVTMPPEGQQLAVYLLQQQPIEVTRPVYTQLAGAERAFLTAVGTAMLMRNGDRTQALPLAKAIRNAPDGDRQAVLNVVWSIDDPRVLEAIRSYLEPTANGALVVSTLMHLRQQEKPPQPATLAAVQALATSDAPAVRAAALAWLAGSEVGPRSDEASIVLAALLTATPDLYPMTSRLFERTHKYPAALTEVIGAALERARSKHEVTQIAALLQSQGPGLAVPALRKLLDTGNEDVRAGALEALATLPGGLEGNALRTMLAGNSPEQQLVAAATLRRMDDPSGLPTVLALCKKPGAHLAEAARVLGGFRSRDAIPVLLDLLDDSNTMVRQHAWQGLQNQWRDLFPYRRFDFDKSGYAPNAGARAAGITTLRAWWAAVGNG